MNQKKITGVRVIPAKANGCGYTLALNTKVYALVDDGTEIEIECSGVQLFFELDDIVRAKIDFSRVLIADNDS